MSDISYGDQHDPKCPEKGDHPQYYSYSNFPYPLRATQGTGKLLSYNHNQSDIIHWGVLWDYFREYPVSKSGLEFIPADFTWKGKSNKWSMRRILTSPELQNFPQYDELKTTRK